MKKYLIYTTNDTDPFTVETDVDLIDQFNEVLISNTPVLHVTHKKDLLGMGTYKYDVMLNVQNIVSITTSEKL